MVEGADGGDEGVGQAGGGEAEEGEGGQGDVEHEAGQGGGGEEDARSRSCCLPKGRSPGCHHVVPPYSAHQVKELAFYFPKFGKAKMLGMSDPSLSNQIFIKYLQGATASTSGRKTRLGGGG